jgi:hypothetical protein
MRKQKEERKSAESRPEASKAEGTVKAGPCEREGICRWKALRIGEAALVDARVVEAVLALGASLQKRGATGVKRSVRGRVADPPRGRKRRARKALPARGARLFLIKLVTRRRDVGRPVRSWSASSNAASPGVGSAKGGPAPQSGWHWAKARCSSRRRSSRREPRAQESSGILGARIVCRLQRSVRHIFPAQPR